MKHGKSPQTIPVIANEIERLITDTNCVTHMEFLTLEPPQVAGMIIEKTDFAEPMRHLRLQMPVIRLSESAEFEPMLELLEGSNGVSKRLFRRLDAFVIGETSKLEFKIEADPWEKVKRWLRITHWLPIRKLTVRVDCTVLYPYIKVTLPHNRHTAKFNAAENLASNAGGAASKSCCGSTPRQPHV